MDTNIRNSFEISIQWIKLYKSRFHSIILTITYNPPANNSPALQRRMPGALERRGGGGGAAADRVRSDRARRPPGRAETRPALALHRGHAARGHSVPAAYVSVALTVYGR